MWEDEAAARAARVAEQAARAHARGLPRSHRSHSSCGGGSRGGPVSQGTGSSRAPSEAACSEISPAPSEHSGRTGDGSLGAYSVVVRPQGTHQAADLPEQLRRAAARVQTGSPRSSAARARGHFAVKVGCVG